ncbi:MAG: OmpA family protein [Bacteroidota bacterium]|nr:OmpA family protein [Bacteroidota bacterium]MDX5430860.1 OmpA family protein [Bacteroidota bacterium]MDX5469604.1 OmpA family protein [Bacteroidota bacterium]
MNRFFLLFLLFISALGAHAQDTLWMEVYYATDKDQLRTEDLHALLNRMPEADTIELISFRIESSCDDRGTEAYNLNLSKRRAQNLAEHLQAKKNYPLSPQISGMGERPLALNSIDTLAITLEREVNRSSRVILIYKRKAIPKQVETNETPVFENLQVGQKMVLESILFVGGHDMFLPESYPSLEALLAKLKANPMVHVKIIGHVCCTPDGGEGMDLETGVYNLSEMRAQAVYLFLVNKGIEKTRLSFEGRGGSEPLGKGEKFDRRVELEIISK